MFRPSIVSVITLYVVTYIVLTYICNRNENILKGVIKWIVIEALQKKY
jgi:hypothetical protein